MRMCYYLQPGKRKAKKMMNMWTEGVTSRHELCVVNDRLALLQKDYVSVFYGVAGTTIGVFNQAVTGKQPWLYLDNQYLPSRRGKCYRVTWNALQHTGLGDSDGSRLLKQNGGKIPHLSAWSTKGRHVLITLQSELYFQLLMPYSRSEWLNHVVKQLKKHTDRPIVVREKPHPSRPYAQRISFEQQLIGCYAIVTLNSATATEGIIKGIPAFVTDPNCAIVPCANTSLSMIEKPSMFDRVPWLQTLADNQWSPAEMREGKALRTLMERRGEATPVPNNLIQRNYKLEDIK